MITLTARKKREHKLLQTKIRRIIKKQGYKTLRVSHLVKKLPHGKSKIMHNLGLMGIDIDERRADARMNEVRQIIDESHRAMICVKDITARVEWLDSEARMARIVAEVVGINGTTFEIRDHYYFAEVDAILAEHGKLDTRKQLFYLLYLAGVDYKTSTNERALERYEASRKININDYLRRKPKTAKQFHKSKGAKK